MYILTQGKPLENCNDNIYFLQISDLEEQYYAAGYHRRERTYKIKYQYKDYCVICPEFVNPDISDESIILIPEFLIPRRPYPVHVYLYAIDMYSKNPTDGQRKVAVSTKKQFGLSTFAHTTLGRALKRFANNIEEIEKKSEKSVNLAINDNEKEIETQTIIPVENIVQENGCVNRHSFPTRRSTEPLRNQVSRILYGKSIQLCRQQFIKLCYELVRKWFKEYQRLLF